MSKCVNRGARIIFGGADISDHVTRWSVGADTGDLYMAEIDILDDSRVILIVVPERPARHLSHGYTTAESGAHVTHGGMRVAIDDNIIIKGEDVSRWVSGYDRITRVGKSDIVRLYVQCDSDVLTINGTTPWEDIL